MADKIIKAFFSFLSAVIMLFYVPSPVTNVNPSNIPKKAKTQDITVMTYNVYVSGAGSKSPENRTPYIVQNIKKYMPDSFGLEEATPERIKLICDSLPEYGYVGSGRDSDGGGEASPVFYNKEKYTVVDCGTFWLSKTPDTPSKGWDAMYNRVCTYAVLRDIKTDFVYAHFNAHFDHIGIVARLESVSLVSQKISELCGNIPVVFSGDLNDYEGGDMYERIIETGLCDTKFAAESVSGGNVTYHGYSNLLKKDVPIDFIFVNAFASKVKSYTVDKTEYNGIYASDHHPVICELTLFNGE